jgi:hypothetical protein
MPRRAAWSSVYEICVEAFRGHTLCAATPVAPSSVSVYKCSAQYISTLFSAVRTRANSRVPLVFIPHLRLHPMIVSVQLCSEL